MSSQSEGPPKEVPLPTPIHFPQCRPASAGPDLGAHADHAHLTTLLQGLVRPADQVQVCHLEALGVCVFPDAPLARVIPSPARDGQPADSDWSLPPFDHWDTLSREQATDYLQGDTQARLKLCNGKPAPGPTKYVDLRQGLLTENERAFRAVRRVTQRPGEQYVRLGYCHDFFRNLEALTSFWDDTSIKLESKEAHEAGQTTEKPTTDSDENAINFYRTSAGSSMPPPFRANLLNSFLKLVTYDFNCNIMSRTEPRLYLTSPLPCSSPGYRRSQFSSSCSFIYRMPLDRDSAKKGMIEGPIAAVSPRHTTAFPPVARDREAVIDLSREVITALITAQHRAREGRVEARIGKDAWWTTRQRWGGGSGGPIGKEAELLEAKEVGAVVVGDKDERPLREGAVVEGDGSLVSSSSTSSASRSSRPSSIRGSINRFNRPIPPSFLSSSSPSPQGGNNSPAPPPKRPRTGLPIYDAYRMVRPPSLQWDPNTRHEAIGRQRGVDYDDVFVISSLFHHVAILRVRVPDRLLDILDGAPEKKGAAQRERLEVWRTQWFDFFRAQDRVEAMKAIWAMMAYAMRETGGKENEGEQKGTATTTTPTAQAGGSGERDDQQSQKMDIDRQPKD